MEMDEKNPLEPTAISQPKKCLQNNARGRPTSENAIKFSPQPKSIISRLLRRVNKQNCAKIHKASISGIHNISNRFNNTESKVKDDNYKNDLIEAEPQLSNTEHCIQGSYAVESEDDNDNYKNSLVTEEPNNAQGPFSTLWEKKCEDQKLLEIACYVCSHRSSSQQEHRKHLSTHRNQLYACNFPDCKYTCKLSCNLIKHKRIHTSEKPYLCDQCTFRSNFANSLKVHKRIHTSERPYCCQHCSYRCNSSSNLKKHCRHKHRILTS